MKENSIILPGNAESANFREIRMGNIAPNTLYRSSHPIKDNKQDEVISLLAAQKRIQTVINLNDTDSEIKLKSIFAPWYNKLLNNDKVLAVGIDFSFNSENFRKKLRKVFQFITISNGPWLIHCHAGVDRTGIVSIVLESLMGATIDDIINDYHKSFNSIYDSSIYGGENKKDSNYEKYIVMRLLSVMGDTMPINDQNLQVIAENYLRNTIGLSAVEVTLLKSKLSGNIET
jgi:protein tyrosine/serine phosphatase